MALPAFALRLLLTAVRRPCSSRSMYLLPAGSTAANPPQRYAAAGWDRRTVSGVGTMGTAGGVHCTPQVQDLYPLYLPSQRCGLCQNFKQTILTTRLYKVRTNLYPSPHLRKLSDAPDRSSSAFYAGSANRHVRRSQARRQDGVCVGCVPGV